MWNILRSKKEKALELLPWYLNHSLGEREARQVGSWLNSSNEALHSSKQLSRIASALRDEPLARPDPKLWHTVRAEIRLQRSYSPGWLAGVRFWVFDALLALILLAVLWRVVEPGTALKWSVSGTVPVTFNVYRARLGGSSYELIHVVQSQTGISEYRYVDQNFAPIDGYIYRVEGVGHSGRIALSQSVIAPPMSALLEQVAVLIASLVISFTLTTAMEYSCSQRLVLANFVNLS